MICGMCEAEAVVRVEAQTFQGKGVIDSCFEHIFDAWMAAAAVCDSPKVILYENARYAFVGLRCPICNEMFTPEHEHASETKENKWSN